MKNYITLKDIIKKLVVFLIVLMVGTIVLGLALTLFVEDNTSDDSSMEKYCTSEAAPEAYNYTPFGTQHEVGKEKERKDKMRKDIDKYRDHFDGNISDEELKEYLVICDGYKYSEVKEELQRQEYESYWNNRY